MGIGICNFGGGIVGLSPLSSIIYYLGVDARMLNFDSQVDLRELNQQNLIPE